MGRKTREMKEREDFEKISKKKTVGQLIEDIIYHATGGYGIVGDPELLTMASNEILMRCGEMERNE